VIAKHVVAVLSLCAGLGFSTAATATVIDFNTVPFNNIATYTAGPVTFTAPGGTLYFSFFGNTPNGTHGIVGYDGTNFPTQRADIAGGTTFVSVDLGDYDSDADTIFLNAFDSSNTLLGSTSTFLAASFTGMVTLSLSTPGIAYVTFGGVGVGGSSVYADNFTFAGGVPEPMTWTMLIAGFGLVGAAMRRRTLAAA